MDDDDGDQSDDGDYHDYCDNCDHHSDDDDLGVGEKAAPGWQNWTARLATSMGEATGDPHHSF